MKTSEKTLLLTRDFHQMLAALSFRTCCRNSKYFRLMGATPRSVPFNPSPRRIRFRWPTWDENFKVNNKKPLFREALMFRLFRSSSFSLLSAPLLEASWHFRHHPYLQKPSPFRRKGQEFRQNQGCPALIRKRRSESPGN